jgi:hypothetical protein
MKMAAQVPVHAGGSVPGGKILSQQGQLVLQGVSSLFNRYLENKFWYRN